MSGRVVQDARYGTLVREVPKEIQRLSLRTLERCVSV